MYMLQSVFTDFHNLTHHHHLRATWSPALLLLLTAFNDTHTRFFCNVWVPTQRELDGPVLCMSNHADICLPLVQIRVSHDRWLFLRTWWCWRMRRRHSTASSLPCRPPRWSGTMRMKSWWTSLGLLIFQILLRSVPLSSFSSCILYSPHLIPSPWLQALTSSISLTPVRWIPCLTSQFCVLLPHSLRMTH